MPVQPNGGKRKRLEVSKKRQLEESTSEKSSKNIKNYQKIIKSIKSYNIISTPQVIECPDSKQGLETEEKPENRTGEDSKGTNSRIKIKNVPSPLETLQKLLNLKRVLININFP